MKKEPSVFDLLVRQVSALVIETVDFTCPEGQDIQDILALEAQCYHVLAVDCAVKHKALRKLSMQASKNKKPGKADVSTGNGFARHAPSPSPRTSAKTGRGAHARGH
jgi:hypothetical protein